MGNKYILENTIFKLISDIRLINYTGRAIPYNQYSYVKIFGDKYQEISLSGYKISILINETELIPNYITLYVWTNEIYSKIYIKESTSINTLEISIMKEKEIIETLITLLLKKRRIENIKNII